MTVHGIERSESLSSQSNTSRIHDTESKGIENQITSARQQLQKLSSDQEMTVEEKKQKRQEVQKQIADLNRELRQRQMELRKEQLEEQQDRKADAKETNKDNKTGMSTAESEKEEDSKEKEEQQITFPKGSMAAIVSADTSKEQADTQRSVVLSLEGTARIMQSEIDLDAGRGQNTERKKAALESIQQRASQASQAQFGLLSNAARNIRKIEPQDRQVFHRQESQDDVRVAAMVGAPQKESAQHALQSYHAGKRYSSVTFHV